MSQGVNKNEPCPCGSGRKFRDCCMAAEGESRRPAATTAVPRALGWLDERYPEATIKAVFEQYCHSLEDEQIERIFRLEPDLAEMFQINALEWVLAEGWLPEADSEEDAPPVFMTDLLLGPGGPLFSAEDAKFLRQLDLNPLDLYEVVDLEPGVGATFQSLLWDEDPVWVEERTATRELEPGDVLGLRILQLEPPILSGALYRFPDPTLVNLLQVLQSERLEDSYEEVQRISNTIVSTWLSVLVGDPPQLVDLSTGDPILLTHVHYRILDWPELERRLNAESRLVQFDYAEESEGSEGIEWGLPQNHVTGVREDEERLAWTVARESESRLVLLSRTSQLAERGEEFLAELAGKTVQRLMRTTESPHQGNREG